MKLFRPLKKFFTPENPVKNALGDKSSLEDLEEALIASDVSGELAQKICGKISNKTPLRSHALSVIEVKLAPGKILWHVNPGDALIFVGMNGGGKTTSVAKVAYKLKNQGLKVILCGADSFRAAAGEQIAIWSKKLSIPCTVAEEGRDSGSVVYKTLSDNREGVVLVDTSGRQTTQAHLMDEIGKIWRIALKLRRREEVKSILVLDGLVGHSTVRQVEGFKKVMEIDGLLMSKLDTTAKGGALLEIVDRFRIPVYGLGVGENLEDLIPFSPREFAEGLCGT